MGLINLLSVGRSLIGVSHGTGHYKLAQGNLLPNFGGARPTGGAGGAPAGGSIGKAADRAVTGSKSAAPVRGTGQGELKLEVPAAMAAKPAPTAVKLAVTEPPKAATAATTASAAVAASPAKAAVAETKSDVATTTTTAAAAAPATPCPRAEAKFTLGRWVSMMLNR